MLNQFLGDFIVLLAKDFFFVVIDNKHIILPTNMVQVVHIIDNRVQKKQNY